MFRSPQALYSADRDKILNHAACHAQPITAGN
jgi:hypothetical protein